MSKTTAPGIDRDASVTHDDDPGPLVCAPLPAVDPQDRIDLDDAAIVEMLTSQDARAYAGFVLEHIEVWGGLRGFECNHPLAFARLRALIGVTTGNSSFAWAYAHDTEILRLVRNSVALQRHARGLADRFPGGSAGATDAYQLADEHELDYASVLEAYERDGDQALRDWYLILDDIDAESLHIDTRTAEVQKAADDAADEAASWKAVGESVLGQQVATKDVSFWWDDDVTLDALATPEDGVVDWDRAIAWARLTGHATAIVEVAGRYFIYTLDHDYDYSDLWETDAFEEARTTLVPSGGDVEALAIVTNDHYVVTPRGGERFFGGHQSKSASRDLIADLGIADDHGETADATALVQQIAFDMLMLQLSDAEQRLRAAQHAVTPDDGIFDPANGTLLQADTADLKDHVVRAAQLSWDASDPPTDDERDAMEDELEEVGRITSLDPIAASMVVNTRDADDTSRPDESQYDDRVAGKMPGDALQLALTTIGDKLDNLDKVRKHYYANPDEVWGMPELIDAARGQLPEDRQAGITYDIVMRDVGEIAQVFRDALKDVVLFSLMFASGEGLFGLALWGLSTVQGLRSVQAGFANADLVEAMSNLDLSGGMQLATPEQAESARRWAWITLGLSVLDSCLFIRSATHMFRLSAIMSDPELAQVLRYTGRPIGELARELGTSERALVAELAAARGAEREALLGKIRALQGATGATTSAERALADVAAARTRVSDSKVKLSEAWADFVGALREASGRANIVIGLEPKVFRALVKLAYRLIENGFSTFDMFLTELRASGDVTAAQLRSLENQRTLQRAYGEATRMSELGPYVEVEPNWARVPGGCSSGCEAAAEQIQALIPGGRVVRIEPMGGAPTLGTFDGANHGWAHHEVVVAGDKVYDMSTGSEGMAIADYKEKWKNAADIKFGF